MTNIESSRRTFLKQAGAAALGVAVAAVALPEIAKANEDEWMPVWDYSQVNTPSAITGSPEERVALSLITNEDNTAAITCGPVEYQDKFGVKVSFTGGQDRASVVIVKGPIGSANGGAEVNPMVLPLYNWVGVAQNPVGGLKSVDLETIAREREASLRSPDGGNFTGSVIDVAIINGRTGAVEEIRTMFPIRS